MTNSHTKFAQLKQLFRSFPSHGRKNTSLQSTDELVDVSSVLVTCVVVAVDDPSDVVVIPGEVVVSGTGTALTNREIDSSNTNNKTSFIVAMKFVLTCYIMNCFDVLLASTMFILSFNQVHDE